jgi:hypothetical protein
MLRAQAGGAKEARNQFGFAGFFFLHGNENSFVQDVRSLIASLIFR